MPCGHKQKPATDGVLQLVNIGFKNVQFKLTDLGYLINININK